jgi:hypothetical protein
MVNYNHNNTVATIVNYDHNMFAVQATASAAILGDIYVVRVFIDMLSVFMLNIVWLSAVAAIYSHHSSKQNS